MRNVTDAMPTGSQADQICPGAAEPAKRQFDGRLLATILANELLNIKALKSLALIGVPPIYSPRAEILTLLVRVAEEQHKVLASLDDDLALLDSGLDSLCLAIIVAKLEDMFGFDPFESLRTTEFPVTIGNLVSLYERRPTSGTPD